MNDHDKLRALVEKWRNKDPDESISPDFIQGWDAATEQCADELEATLAALSQGEAFTNSGDSEAQFIAHHADSCPHCGGSGHAGDIAHHPEAQQPEAVAPSGKPYVSKSEMKRVEKLREQPEAQGEAAAIPEAVERNGEWVVETPALTLGFRSREGATAWNALRRMVNDGIYTAAPKPVEGVTEAMVERAESARVKCLNAVTAYGSAGVEERYEMAMRAALNAALTPATPQGGE